MNNNIKTKIVKSLKFTRRCSTILTITTTKQFLGFLSFFSVYDVYQRIQILVWIYNICFLVEFIIFNGHAPTDDASFLSYSNV
jgi:hypothetical protein